MCDEEALRGAVGRALGHRFVQPDLLREALTHRSYANEQPHLAPSDNERLEFLGDAVLDLAVSTLLWDSFPGAPEGELTRRRADLVRESTLADIARGLGIADALRLGRGEERSGGRDKPRLLASALEACMGAVLLDAGVDRALTVGRGLYEGRLSAAPPGAADYKSRAQELSQSRGRGTPRYDVVSIEGPHHERIFRIAFVLGEEVLAEGHGRSKLEAEQSAARAALEHLEDGE